MSDVDQRMLAGLVRVARQEVDESNVIAEIDITQRGPIEEIHEGRADCIGLMFKGSATRARNSGSFSFRMIPRYPNF